MSDSFTYNDLTAGDALNTLVGREDLLNAVLQTIHGAGQNPQTILMTGDGGIGKTRLIYAIRERLRREQRYIVALEEIDAYDQDAHSKQRLASRIAEVLPEQVSFARYRDALRELQLAEQRGDQQVARLRREVEQACVADLRAAAELHRVVLLIDTAERLVYVKENTGGKSLFANSWDWVTSDLLKIPNITWVIAGRDKCKILFENIEHTPFSIPDFDETGARAYFEAIIQRAAQDKNDEVVRRLRTVLDPGVFSRVFRQTEGRPLRLALLADLLIFHNLEGESLEATEREIISRLMGIGDIGAMLRALGRLRRGADPDLLAAVLGQTEEGFSPSRVNRLLKVVSTLSFVKKPRGERYFLHDIMYELLDRYEFSQDRERREGRKTYRAAVEFYKRQTQQQREMLDQIFAPIEAGHGRAGRRLDRDALAAALQGRRQVLLDRLYYQLCADPHNGFRFYLRYTFDAIFGGDPTFDVLLQAEILNFLNELKARGEHERYNLSPDVVQGIAIIRPVARAFSEANFVTAVDAAERIRREYQEHYPDQRGTDSLLNIWQAAALTEIAGKENLARAENLLHAAINQLGGIISEGGPEHGQAHVDRARVGLAFGYMVLGDYYRQIDLQREAREAYTNAVKLGREVRVLVNLATSLNRLGLVLSRLGYLQDAEALVEEGLALRREIGLRAAIAGAGSSLGVVLNNQGAYPQAIARAGVALDIYEALGNTLGIAQTRCNLAEAERRYGSSGELITIEERLTHLSAARQHADEAVQLAKTLKATRTHARALIEQGCALRELARITYTEHLRQFSIHRLVAESRTALHAAAEVASESLPWMRLDALTNLAYLYYYVGEDSQAQIELKAALAAAPQEYLLVPGAGQPKVDEVGAQATFWLHIAKLKTLQGHIAYRQLIELRQNGEQKGTSESSSKELDLLKTCAEAFTLAMEYSERYSNNLPGIQRSQHQIYNRLRTLEVEDLRVFGKEVQVIEATYGLAESVLRQMLTRRTLWFD